MGFLSCGDVQQCLNAKMVVKKNSKPLSTYVRYRELLNLLVVTLDYNIKYRQMIFINTQTVCGLCGYVFKNSISPNRLSHFKKEHEEWTDAYWLRNDIKQIKNEYLPEKVKRVHLKPWKDPDSLFCDTDFLRQYSGACSGNQN